MERSSTVYSFGIFFFWGGGGEKNSKALSLDFFQGTLSTPMISTMTVLTSFTLAQSVFKSNLLPSYIDDLDKSNMKDMKSKWASGRERNLLHH